MHIPFERKLLIASLIRLNPESSDSFILSRTFSRFFVRKLLIINDACPNNTTAGSFIKRKLLVIFSAATDSFWPAATQHPFANRLFLAGTLRRLARNTA